MVDFLKMAETTYVLRCIKRFTSLFFMWIMHKDPCLDIGAFKFMLITACILF